MFLGYTSLSSFSTLLSTVSHSPPHSHSPLQWLHVVVHLQAVCGMVLWVGIWQPLIRERVSWFYSFWDSFEFFFLFFGGGVDGVSRETTGQDFFFHNVWRTVPRIYYTIEVEHPSLTEKHEMIMTLSHGWAMLCGIICFPIENNKPLHIILIVSVMWCHHHQLSEIVNCKPNQLL